MEKEKQIEEMAKANCAFCRSRTNCKLDTCDCAYEEAEYLYNEGYRNQIKAEWKSGNKNGQFGYYCTNCDACFTGENAEWIAKEHIYCPKCGAKMKGD